MERELSDAERQILEYIYRTFKAEGRWVNSRHLVHDLQALGDAYEVANRIGGELVRIEDPDGKEDALAKLTVKGVAACKGSEQDLLDFVSVLQLFVHTYCATRDGVPRVTADDFISELGLSELQARKMTMLILEGGGLYSSAGYGGTEPAHFELDRRILPFKGVNSIQDYFTICEQDQAKRRAASATSPVAQEALAYDIFISYSHKDEKLAGELRDLLEERGLRCFMSSSDISTGDLWTETIRNALVSAQELLLLITPDSVHSQWVLIEASAGWALAKRLVPALLKVDPESLPEPIKRHQAKRIDTIESREKLAAEIAKRLGK